jgi:glycosyltransferase involved in cell wall biosynthesis
VWVVPGETLKIVVLKSRWGHMGEVSGFPLSEVLRRLDCSSVQIEDLPVPKDLQPLAVPKLYKRILRKVGFSRLSSRVSATAEGSTSSGSVWSNARHQAAARQALTILERHRDAVILLPAAEDEFCSEFALADSAIKRRIFACFHQPPAWFRLNWRRLADLESLGGIFCLASCQESYFKSVSSAPVHLIRHGVRHDFFSPPEDLSVRVGIKLLFVGQWLRDFETLANAMPRIWEKMPEVRLDCVVPRFARGSDSIRRLAMDHRVFWHADLNDGCLKSLYQNSDLLFLPVLDATANNAVLEAMASGLPVISSDVGGISEYLPRDAGQLCRAGDAESHADTVIEWLSAPAKRVRAGMVARKVAVEEFDWGQIGRKLLHVIVD